MPHDYPADVRPVLAQILPGHHRNGHGIHGLAHWARVLENGLRVGADIGANLSVVAYFAIFHDARRINDDRDPGHGARGAALAREVLADGSDLSADEVDVLDYACTHHTDGLIEAEPTVQACWDADRLDLPRVGIWVRPDRLCTAAAREPDLIRWAEDRASRDHRPAFLAEWSA